MERDCLCLMMQFSNSDHTLPMIHCQGAAWGAAPAPLDLFSGDFGNSESEGY